MTTQTELFDFVTMVVGGKVLRFVKMPHHPDNRKLHMTSYEAWLATRGEQMTQPDYDLPKVIGPDVIATEVRFFDGSKEVTPTVGDFAWAITQVKGGKHVTRKGWNGRGMWIALMTMDKGGRITRPYVYMKTVNGEYVPWVASQTDLLADDWTDQGVEL